jgi:glycosyltransferase involved in cell wall biosynthesis
VHLELIVQQVCARVPGGTGRYTAELARAVVATAPLGAVVTGLAGRHCPALGEIPLTVRRLHVDGRLLSRLWERGIGPRSARPVDVVHAPTLLIPPRPARARLVVTIHDVVPWTHPETLTPRGVRFHVRMGERAARQADLIVTPSEAVAHRVREVLAPGCAVVSVPLGVRPAAVPADAIRRRDRLTLPSRYILFVGTAEPRKGLDVLVPALQESALDGVSLVVVGPGGWGNVQVADLAAAAGVGPRVHVVGMVSDADLAAVYAGAQALALPSRAEGFGLPVLEAMSHDVPVVTSDDPALVEVAGGAGLVAPVGDVGALAQELARAIETHDALVARGRVRVRGFTWERTARRMWQEYARLES